MKLLYKLGICFVMSIILSIAFSSCEEDANFKIVEYPAHTVTGFSPTSGKVGQTITITGTNFGDNVKAVKVFFGATLATLVSINDTTIVVKIPDGTSGPLTINVWNHTVVTPDSFTILPSAKIDGISPTIGIEGTLVKINGVNFGTDKNAVVVKFNSGTLLADIISITNNEIQVKAPIGVQAGYISVTKDGIELQTKTFNEGYLNFNYNTTGNKEGWDITNNATALISGGYYNVTFDPSLFLGTSKRRADFKLTAGAVVHPGNFPILAIKFNKPAVVNLTLDTSVGSYKNGANKWDGIIPDKNNNGKDIYYFDMRNTFGASTLLSQTASTTLSTFQWKVADITSPELGYSVDWVKTFTSLAELQAYANQ
ncbi:DUF4979 domain-containing protein [Flavobacterium aquiphilum]|uniref:DUF4979 domain-containing protein n=1 Tax=Flavobacterium aquiphilum TaxID=3003261 RepID=UPI002480477D|nr:DUF4979 domain-containing protein [Flavobacterium aquiphilum]